VRVHPVWQGKPRLHWDAFCSDGGTHFSRPSVAALPDRINKHKATTDKPCSRSQAEGTDAGEAGTYLKLITSVHSRSYASVCLST
jgi:hypothetical protein